VHCVTYDPASGRAHYRCERFRKKPGETRFDFVSGYLQCYDHEFGGITRRADFSRRPEEATRSILNKLNNHSRTGYEGEHRHGS
jgi:hypothetical protein